MDFSVGHSDQPLRLLIIDGAHARAQRMVTLLREFGYTLKAARLGRAREALSALQQHSWDLVLIETDFASKYTIIAFAKLARHKHTAPLLSYADSQKDATAIRLTLENGARDFLCLDEPQRIQQILSRELGDLMTRRALHHYEQLFIKQLQQHRTSVKLAAQDLPHETAATQAPAAQTPIQEIDPAKTMPPEPPPLTGAAATRQTAVSDTDLTMAEPEQEKSLLLQRHDPLTGLYSPTYFLGALKQSLSNSNGIGSGLLHMEIDNIDQLRAQCSSEIIQLLLSETAGLLCQFQSHDCVATYSDDASFTILINDKNRDEIVAAAKHLRKLIFGHDFSHLDPDLESVSCSIGLCINEQHSAADAELLLSQAHHACNKAIQGGGNKICAYAKKTDTQSRHAPGSWPEKIEHALRDNRFTLVFQPIITFNSAAEEYYELFLRMLDTENNEILPAKFMLAAEESDLMTSIDRWVTQNSMTRLVENHANKGHTNFFIKVSLDSILDPNFLPWLIKQSRKTKGISSHLTFEINEAYLARQPQETRTFAHLLRELHCHTALEHFGTLPDSLQLLETIDVDYVKLDHSLLHDLHKNPNNARIIRNIIDTAHRKDIKVIAVAVQDAHTLSTLWHYNIDHIQGYFLQKPAHDLCFDFTQQTL